MRKLVVFILLAALVNVNAASITMKVLQQKPFPNGQTYAVDAKGDWVPSVRGGGIYFEVKDIEPLIMYKIQYSTDLKNWIDLIQVVAWYNSTTSPYYGWHELPKNKCFFRIIEAW
jgi:hypothetical protein